MSVVLCLSETLATSPFSECGVPPLSCLCLRPLMKSDQIWQDIALGEGPEGVRFRVSHTIAYCTNASQHL